MCELPQYLILPLASAVVQVGVAPVVVDPLLCLLVHPVQLIGAALHVVPKTQQVALTFARAGLNEVRKCSEPRTNEVICYLSTLCNNNDGYSQDMSGVMLTKSLRHVC